MTVSIPKELNLLCQKYGVGLVYIFGSQSKEGIKVLSGKIVTVNDPLTDLDVGIVTIDPLPKGYERVRFYADLFNELEDFFKPFRLDLVLLEENHSVFQVEAIKGICIYQASEEFRDNYEMMILRRAADFRPFLEKYLKEVLEEVK